MPIKIQYNAEDFPANPHVTNGQGALTIEWDALLWAAITVGRPNRYHVFRHGLASMYEVIFRFSMVRLALEQQTGSAFLTRTNAAETLDPSEKGAINYFLGLVFCRLFAAEMFDAPWALHLDVFHRQIGDVLHTGSRPDLVAQRHDGNWIVFESKGRKASPTAADKQKAKEQASRITSINGRVPLANIAGIFYHYPNVAKFFMRDPEPDKDSGFALEAPENVWRIYYQPVASLFMDEAGKIDESLAIRSSDTGLELAELDVRVKVHPHLMDYLIQGQWELAKEWCDENRDDLIKLGYKADGTAVVAGPSWSERFQGIEGMEKT